MESRSRTDDGAQAQGSGSTDPLPPAWLDVPLPYRETIRGLPAFATPEWFARWTRLSPTAVRHLRAGIARRRRQRPDLLPWWPDKVNAATVFWAFARAAIDPVDSVALTKVVVAECKDYGGGLKSDRASIFNPLIMHHVVMDDERKGGTDTNHPETVFAAVYEGGVDGAVYAVQRAIERGVDPATSEIVSWCMDRHPEAAGIVEEALALREARERRHAERRQALLAEARARREETGALTEAEARDDLLSALGAVEAEREALAQDLADLDRRHVELRRELAAVRAGHDPRLAAGAEEERLPEAMPELLEWIERRLAPDVHVLPRAFRSLKKAPDVDVPRLARGLRFLRDVYVPWRSDRGLGVDAYRAAQVECGFDETASFASASSLDAFPEYRATWNGRPIQLDRHLKRGYGSDPKVMIRVYFAWDRETRTVVVGHMPGHLDNWRS